METANLRLFSAKGERKFVFLVRQTINGKRRLLFQQTCPSMVGTDRINAWFWLRAFANWSTLLTAEPVSEGKNLRMRVCRSSQN